MPGVSPLPPDTAPGEGRGCARLWGPPRRQGALSAPARASPALSTPSRGGHSGDLPAAVEARVRSVWRGGHAAGPWRTI